MLNMTEPLYVDNSILTKVAVCDTASVIRYVLGMTTWEERATFLVGTAGHEAMAQFFKGYGKDAAMDKFDELYRDWATANVPPEYARSYENAYKCISVWFDNHPLDRLPFRVIPEWVEIGFSYPLVPDGSIVYVGRIDAIVQELNSDALRILDHKFTARLDGAFARNFRMDSQFSGYIWSGQQQLAAPVDGGFVNAIELTRLPSDPTRKCPKHAVVYAECGELHANSDIILVNRTPQAIKQWKRDAIVLAKRFGELKEQYSDPAYLPIVPMQGQFVYKACSNCESYDFCAAHKPVAQINSMFQHLPWEPWKSALDGKESESDGEGYDNDTIQT